AQHAPAVAPGAQVRLAVQARRLEAGDLADAHPRGDRAQEDLGLDLEAVAPQPEGAGAVAPHPDEPVAEVAEVDAVEDVDHPAQDVVAEGADRAHVGGAAAAQEARALDEVVAARRGAAAAVAQAGQAAADLRRVHAAVGVDHDDEVAARGREAGADGDALARALLQADVHDGTRPLGGLDRSYC